MDEIRELRGRIQILEDIEAIRKLKARYWLCIDRKSWDQLGDCFTGDAVIDVPPRAHWVGKKEIVENLSEILEPSIICHHGHHADIEITGESTAKATWAMYDILQDLKSMTMEGWGFYEDEYVKENGRWKIKNSKITRIFVRNLTISDIGFLRQKLPHSDKD